MCNMERMKLRGGSYPEKESHRRSPEFVLEAGEDADGEVCHASSEWSVVRL